MTPLNKIMAKIHSDPRGLAVFYGMIASLLATAIWQVSPFVLSWLGEYTFGLLTNFIDSKYAKAASLEPTDYSYFILSLIFVICVIAWSEISSSIKKALKEEEKREEAEKPKKQPIPGWVPGIFLIVRGLVWFYLAWGLLFLAGETTALNAMTDFKQHMRIVAPYVDESEEELLLSKWSQMKTLDDYNDVYEELIKIAKDNGLILYRNRRY